MNKKGLTNSFIFVIIALIAMILISLWISNVIENAKYDSSINECKTFFQNVDGKPSFFSTGGDPNEVFFSGVEKICPSKDVEVSDNYVKPAAELVSDCFVKAGLGEDFYSSTTTEYSLCLYCGKIKGDYVEEFDEKFVNEISKDNYDFLFEDSYDIQNKNEKFLKTKEFMPDNLESGESIGVFYLIAKPSVISDECFDSFSDHIDCSIDVYSRAFSYLFYSFELTSGVNYILSDTHADSIGAVFFGVVDDFETDGDLDRDFGDGRITMGYDASGNELNCVMVIPDKNFD